MVYNVVLGDIMFYEKIELGLEKMIRACEKLNNPQNKFKSIHIAGTNGKGSVGKMISYNLSCQGYKVGHFSSPAVLNYYDIWQINGERISRSEYDKFYSIAKNAADDATQFEIETIIAFLYFAENNCDYAVIEVGMGGKLDATNVLGNKILSVITTIAIDHTKFLGNTLEEIALQKAGIIGDGKCVSAFQAEEAKNAVLSVSNNVKFIEEPKNVRYYDFKTVFDYKNYSDIEISLLGKYQVYNACLAIEALDYLGLFDKNGFKNMVWHCRFERINNFVLDGAHNPNGIKALEENINIYLKNKSITFITGIFKDKDYKSVAYIAKYADKIYTVESENPRCLSAEDWKNELIKYCANTLAVDSIEKAVHLAQNDEAVLVFGSLSIMADVYKGVKALVQ